MMNQNKCFLVLLLSWSYAVSSPVPEPTTPCPDELTTILDETPEVATLRDTELDRFQQESKTEILNEDGTTLCPEELEKLKLAENQKQDAVNKGLTNQPDTTTPCPEELENQKFEKTDNTSDEETTTTALLAQEQEEANSATQTENEIQPPHVNDLLLEDTQPQTLEQTTTACPLELAKRQEHENLLKSLLGVHKDSALLKLTQTNIRERRQVASSQYYKDQSSYDPSMYNTQEQSSYFPIQQQQQQQQPVTNYKNPQPVSITYNNKPKPANTVRTYQQLQRAQNQAYPKNYAKVKPVRGYQNPNLYVRTGTNYQKHVLQGNRRQSQSRGSNATRKSTRRNTKKKFRPSPVFV